MLATRPLFTGAVQDAPRNAVWTLTDPDDAGGGTTVGPRCVCDGPVTWITFIDGEGYQGVVRFDVSTGARTITRLVETAEEVDDHDNPALLLREGGGVLAVWALHNGDVFAALSDDGVTWGAAANITSQLGADIYTYARLERMPDGIHLYLRKGGGLTEDATLARSISTDEGATWSAAAELIVGNYFQFARTGGRLDFFAAENSTVGIDHVRHGYYEGGSFHKSDGTEITATQPFARSQLTTVYDNSGGYPHAIGVAITQGPAILLLEYNSGLTVRTYRQARWTGSVWAHRHIADAGPGLAARFGADMPEHDPDTVYLCRPVSGTWQVFRYRTADAGETWAGAQLTSAASDCLRVFTPRGDAIVAGWWQGVYVDALDWTQGIGIIAARGPA